MGTNHDFEFLFTTFSKPELEEWPAFRPLKLEFNHIKFVNHGVSHMNAAL